MERAVTEPEKTGESLDCCAYKKKRHVRALPAAAFHYSQRYPPHPESDNNYERAKLDMIPVFSYLML